MCYNLNTKKPHTLSTTVTKRTLKSGNRLGSFKTKLSSKIHLFEQQKTCNLKLIFKLACLFRETLQRPKNTQSEHTCKH